ncbi:glutaredoxin 1 [Klebsiella pneumoniae]|uniref:Glutaredoxin 1 n=1 Tax=Klebsiella pneumoniae TaxID=573 RepID=A0A4P0Y171_KLEPN|nr:glutaredoxin 1 [Klebsiella pneumoniae]
MVVQAALTGVRAKELAEKLTNERDDFNYRYVDIHAEGISKADLEKTVGKPVETVPQIFVDQKHIGGCTDLKPGQKRISACLPESIYLLDE